MQGIYNYTPETNRVSRVYTVAAVLYRQFLLHVMYYYYYYYYYYYFCCDRGFESYREHGCLSVVSVLCCQVEVSATD